MRLLTAVCFLLVQYCTSFPSVQVFWNGDPNTINTPDKAGFTPLMNSCLCNDLKAVEHLTEHGAALDQQFEGGATAGNTALFFAAKYGHDDIVTFLLARGADINHVNKFDENALFQFSTAKVAEILLKAGIKVNRGHFFPIVTTLLLRFHDEHSEKLKILQLLIDYGAKVDDIVTDDNFRYDKLYYPILYASSKEEIDMLVGAGANINTVGRDEQSLLYKLIDRMDPGSKDETTVTVLHILNKYPQVDLELRDNRRGITPLTRFRSTPLYRCLILESEFPNTCFGDAHGKDIGHALVAKGKFGASGLQCLLFAIKKNLFLAAKSLWLASSRYSRENRNASFLSIAVSFATGLIKELFHDDDPKSFGSVDEFDLTNSPNKLNSRGQTAIFVAAKFNYLDYLEKEVRLAMESQKSKQLETFDLEIPSEVKGVKYTPLMAALDGDNELVAEWLIKWGANCNSVECIAKAVETVSNPINKATGIIWPFKLLFKSKIIPIDYISPNGESLLMMAARHGNHELIKYYFKNVQHPVEINTEKLSEIVDDDKTFRIIAHLSKTLPTVSEDHCGICLQNWEDDTEDAPKQGVPYWCAGRGHVYHYDCAARWKKKTCPLCTAEIKEPDDVLNFPISKKDMER